MDLPRLNALSKLQTLYPGHFPPEISLFTLDPTTHSITNAFQDVSDAECLPLATQPIPASSTQLIRIRCKAPLANPSPAQLASSQTDLGSLTTLLDALGFPLAPVLAARQDQRLILGQHIPLPSSQSPTHGPPIFYTAGSRTCLIWSPSPPPAPTTRALLVTFMHTTDETPFRLHELLQHLIFPPLTPAFTHPFFFALVLASTLQTQTMTEYTSDARTLHAIENAFVTRKSAARVTTMQALRDLARLAIQDGYIFGTLETLLTFAMEHPVSRAWERHIVAERKKSAKPTIPDPKATASTAAADDEHASPFPALARTLQSSLALDQTYLTSILSSVSNQQTALAEIVAMQDGASMKTIAFITLIFLPATFLATMFAMPMFTWDDERREVVQREFWLYWASVGPLTVGVAGGWGVWWWVRGVRRRFDDRTKGKREDLRTWVRQTWGGEGGEEAEGREKGLRMGEGGERDGEGYVKLQGTRRRTFLKQFYSSGEENGGVGKIGRASQV